MKQSILTCIQNLARSCVAFPSAIQLGEKAITVSSHLRHSAKICCTAYCLKVSLLQVNSIALICFIGSLKGKLISIPVYIKFWLATMLGILSAKLLYYSESFLLPKIVLTAIDETGHSHRRTTFYFYLH